MHAVEATPTQVEFPGTDTVTLEAVTSPDATAGMTTSVIPVEAKLPVDVSLAATSSFFNSSLVAWSTCCSSESTVAGEAP